MNTARRFMIITLLTAVLVHGLVVWLTPSLLMGLVIAGTEARARGSNRIFHPPRVDINSRDVVRPAPDLAYSVCAFDVHDAALKVVFPKSDAYSSVSFFDMDTDNFFVLNDLDVSANEQVIHIVGPDQADTALPGEGLRVIAPSDRGLVLFRSVIPSPAHWESLDTHRRKASCETIPLVVSALSPVIPA